LNIFLLLLLRTNHQHLLN